MDWPGRWDHLNKLLERGGPFTHPEFEPSPETLSFLLNTCRVLVVGAGGLGCELLKDLALMGFRHLDVIDMDTIDLSNLNRQFLFRTADVGKPKAEVAADYINNRVSGCQVKAHYCKIQDYDGDFYSRFHLIVCGLDSIVARRWINCMICSLLRYEDGELLQNTVIPFIDGGTEGFKGNARVIIPGMTACVECTLDLFPPQVNFPLCTIAHTPRLPEHCIEWARILLWPKENPFGENTAIDGDDPTHISWIYEKALERASQFGINGVTYRLTQGVVKHIIPAVASTNAVISAMCSLEVFKLATSCYIPLNNYMVLNTAEGIYSYTFESERKPDCIACSQVPKCLEVREDAKLEDVVEILKGATYQMKNPGITMSVGGNTRMLYMPSIQAFSEKSKSNIKKTLKELELYSDSELLVSDTTSPNSVVFRLTMTPQHQPMEEVS